MHADFKRKPFEPVVNGSDSNYNLGIALASLNRPAAHRRPCQLFCVLEKIVKRLMFVLLLCTLCLANAAYARPPVPIVNLENQPIAATSGKPLTLDEVHQALRKAAALKGWTIAEVAPGKAVGTLVVRNKHTIKTDIAYSEDTMSFTYKDSVNMKYGKDMDEQPVIHPFYMNWVRELFDAVKIELARF